jgi:hypothetical protein
MTDDEINHKIAELAGFKIRSEADPQSDAPVPVFSEEEVWVSPKGKVHHSVPDFVGMNGRDCAVGLLRSKGIECE